MDTEIQRALITGGSRGIGFNIAQILTEHGIDVCIAGKSSENLARAQELLLQTPISGKVHTLQIDLQERDAPEKLISETAEKLGGLDLLVNNAGVSLNATLEHTSMEDWDRIMHINARAPYFLCQKALPWLRKSKAPTIIQIASVVAHAGYADQSAYTASKHALLGMTKAFSKEVQQEGIRVYTLSPGGVATDMIRSVRPDIDEDDLIDPTEIADLVWFLLTHRESAMIDHLDIRRATKTAWS
ncbi:MAG: SDR family oxidoreductase [Sphaerochaeta sp.]|nr:SDR family oxidoreductase [Sphaerochaeta sp.]